MSNIAHRHTGILVKDFDQMLKFYIGLGFELRRRDIEKGQFVEHLLNADDIVLETAKLVLQDERIPTHLRFNLELMQIINRTNEIEISSMQSIKKNDIYQRRTGVLDISFTVYDIQSTLQFITDNGGRLISEAIKCTTGFPALHSYAQDLEGNVLHIAQNINT